MKRKLKPLPRKIFDFIRVTVFSVITIILLFYLMCIGIYVNACQMDAMHDYLIQEMENR